MENINNSFLEHNFIHRGNNLFGEMYEAWVYEYIKSWANYCPDVSSFVLKDPALKTDMGNGLNYDKNGQIIYISNGKKIAEYDALFIYKDKVVFVESSVSELRSYFRSLQDKLIKKRKLLVEEFGIEEVYYLVVTRPRKKSLTYRSLPHLILYTLKNPEFDLIEKTDRDYSLNSNKFVSLKSISSSF